MNGSKTTTWTGIGSAVFMALTVLSSLAYQLGDIAEIIPPEWKAKIVLVSLTAATILKIWNSVATAGTGDVKALEKRVDQTIDSVNEIK